MVKSIFDGLVRLGLSIYMLRFSVLITFQTKLSINSDLNLVTWPTTVFVAVILVAFVTHNIIQTLKGFNVLRKLKIKYLTITSLILSSLIILFGILQIIKSSDVVVYFTDNLAWWLFVVLINYLIVKDLKTLKVKTESNN